MFKKISRWFMPAVLGLAIAGGMLLANPSTAEAANFYDGDTTVVTDDSSVYYPGDGTARMYLQQSYGGRTFSNLVAVSWDENRVYILNANGYKQFDAYGRYIMLGDYNQLIVKNKNKQPDDWQTMLVVRLFFCLLAK